MASLRPWKVFSSSMVSHIAEFYAAEDVAAMMASPGREDRVSSVIFVYDSGEMVPCWSRYHGDSSEGVSAERLANTLKSRLCRAVRN